MRNKVGWGVMTLLALAEVLLASRYLTLDPAHFFAEQRAIYSAHLTVLILHVSGGMVALTLGPLLFLAGMRRRWPALHRWLGRFYLLGILIGGSAGLMMSTYAYAGAIARSGFATLALLWLTTGVLAFIHIRNGNVDEHRRWMVRNFALTLAGVLLRLQLPLLMTGLDFAVAYKIVAWSSWAPNLFIAEWLLRRQRPAVVRSVAKRMGYAAGKG